jgi:DNA-binding CsgD family transcriptional regulator
MAADVLCNSFKKQRSWPRKSARPRAVAKHWERDIIEMPFIVETCHKTNRNSGAESVSLSRRELQLARLAAEGRLNKEISYTLGLTEGTVKVYMSGLFAKLGVANRAELAAWATRHEEELDRTYASESSAHEARPPQSFRSHVPTSDVLGDIHTDCAGCAHLLQLYTEAASRLAQLAC